MSDDDEGEDFTNRYQLHLMRAAARQAESAQARVDAAEIKRKAAEFVEALKQELLTRRAVSVPPAPAAQPALIASPARVTLS